MSAEGIACKMLELRHNLLAVLCRQHLLVCPHTPDGTGSESLPMPTQCVRREGTAQERRAMVVGQIEFGGQQIDGPVE